ncbi:hypothetical protein KS880_000936 [Vibrio parahaemolyticus]|nr:hypothetical protein [Vibrio parahaemolyticus]
MTADRKETEVQPIKPGIEIMTITVLAIFTCIFLTVLHMSESKFQARCRGYEDQIEKSLQQALADKNELHLIQTGFQQYQKVCSAH